MTASVQKEEQKVLAEPTTLMGAVRALNRLNDGKATAAQQRLKNRGTAVLDRSDSSVEFVAEVKPGEGEEREASHQVDSSRGGEDRHASGTSR